MTNVRGGWSSPRLHVRPGSRASAAGTLLVLSCIILFASCQRAAADFICYRGQLHAHSTLDDGKKDALAVYLDTYAAGLDTFALQAADNLVTDEEWALLGTYVAQATTPGEYVALRGFEWKHTYSSTGGYGGDYGEGHAGVFNTTVMTHPPRYNALGRPPTAEESQADLTAFYEWVAQAESADGTPVVAQFNHPSGGLTTRHFEDFEAPWRVAAALRATAVDRVALFEMGTGIGTYYGPTWDPGNGRTNEVLFKVALNNGWRLAPTVSEDNKTTTMPATPHRTGIWAEALTHAGIMEALHSRRTFCSDDVDLQISFLAGSEWMGSTLSVPDLSLVTFHASWLEPTDPIQRVWLVKSPGDETELDLTGLGMWSDTVSVSAIVLGGEWYYMKLQEADGHLAYSAPIWIAPTTPVTVNAGTDQWVLPSQSAALSAVASDGRAPYSYSWTPADGLSDPDIASPSATPSQTTTYTVTATDAVGRMASDTVTVHVDTTTLGPTSSVTGHAGATVSVPIELDLASGEVAERAGFSLQVTPNGGAPAISTSISFTSAITPAPSTVTNPGGHPYELQVSWGPATTFSTSPGQLVTLGTANITIPATAAHGDSYTIHMNSGSALHHNGLTWVSFGTLKPDVSLGVPVVLSLSAVGPGSVLVDGAPVALPYTGEFAPGSQAALQAVPATDVRFGSWSGSLSGTAAQTTLTMDADKSITASFQPILTVDVDGYGDITIDGLLSPGYPFSTGCDYFTSVVLQAFPLNGWYFRGWYDTTDNLIITAPTTTWTMNVPRSLVAKFLLLPDARAWGSGTYIDQSTKAQCTISLDVQRASGVTGGTVTWYNSKTRKRFVSTAVSTLQVSGDVATITGSGTVNGETGFAFTLVVTDGSPDHCAMTVSKGATVYTAAGNMTRGSISVLP